VRQNLQVPTGSKPGKLKTKAKDAEYIEES
jgi:hypothetical protein